MGRRHQLSARERGKIDAYQELHLSKRDIARRIRRSVHAITSYTNDKLKYGNNMRGRSRVTTKYDDRRILREASNSTKSSVKIRYDLNLNCNARTVRRRIKDASHIMYKKMLMKPPLTAVHKQRRLQFCRVNMQRTWTGVWFTDEKKFNLDGPDREKYYFHDLRKETLISSRRQQGGGSVLLWAGFCATNKSSIAFVHGNLNSAGYQNILQQHLLPFYQLNDELVQDNAPIHSSASTLAWLNNNNIEFLDWPSRSPDLNPMETLWSNMSRDIYSQGRQYANVRQLKDAINVAWANITVEQLSNLSNSMSGRIFQCIFMRGGYTKY